MESGFEPPKQSPPRRIVIENAAFGYGNMEAWANILRSYVAQHPHHRPVILYEGEPVQSLTYLFKLGRSLNHAGFELVVAAQDGNFKQVPKLFRLLVEGAGPDYGKFLSRELHQTLALF